MQDIHPIGGGGGRFFAGGDRRLRPNNHLQTGQALKCPRCDSLNTKFCYYNNYNLSQPRHFCKSCRRYWTKGGVLRNVPVGGGCRKSKRSKPKSTPTNAADASPEKKSNSHSSSESSSLTASTTAAAAAVPATAEVVSSNSASAFLNFSESNFFLPNTGLNQQAMMENTRDVQFQDIGSLSSMITSSNDQSMISFNMADIPAYQNSNEQQWNQPSKIVLAGDLKMEQTDAAGFFNQTGRVDFTTGLQQQSEQLASVDWQAGGGDGDHGLFDQSYWSQTQWGENDHSLNFLP